MPRKADIQIENTYYDDTGYWRGRLRLYGNTNGWWNIQVDCPPGAAPDGTFMPFTDADAIKLRDALLEAYPLEHPKPAPTYRIDMGRGEWLIVKKTEAEEIVGRTRKRTDAEGIADYFQRKSSPARVGE